MDNVDFETGEAALEKTVTERLFVQANRLVDFSERLNEMRCVGNSFCKPQISETVYQYGRSMVLTVVTHAREGTRQLRIVSDAERVLQRLEANENESHLRTLEIERQRGRIEQAKRLAEISANHVETATKDLQYIMLAPEEWEVGQSREG